MSEQAYDPWKLVPHAVLLRERPLGWAASMRAARVGAHTHQERAKARARKEAAVKRTRPTARDERLNALGAALARLREKGASA